MSRGIIEQEIVKYQRSKCNCGNNSHHGSNTSRSTMNTNNTPTPSSPIPIPAVDKHSNSTMKGKETQHQQCRCDTQRYEIATWNMFHRIHEHRRKYSMNKSIHKQTTTTTNASSTQGVTKTLDSLVIDSKNNTYIGPDMYYESSHQRNMMNNLNVLTVNNHDNNVHNNEEMLWELEL
mmetsp:Transcript_28838/g.32336  ORF Transcript_28838/g.32336 Transcript_28838/m.32336 type:complete len:177 (+) Transcript_28838:186-716(+)